jgi:hypothetical protein
MHYTQAGLKSAIVSDLVTDIRCARRDGQNDYEMEVTNDLRRVFANRHRLRLDEYGWPKLDLEKEA